MVGGKLGCCGFGIGAVEGAPQTTVWGRSALGAPLDGGEGWPEGLSWTERTPRPEGAVLV